MILIPPALSVNVYFFPTCCIHVKKKKYPENLSFFTFSFVFGMLELLYGLVLMGLLSRAVLHCKGMGKSVVLLRNVIYYGYICLMLLPHSINYKVNVNLTAAFSLAFSV